MQVAMELFYNQGYRATGINEVIDRSGVAKATFYNHFPSKDELGVAYLKELLAGELAWLDSFLQKAQSPVERFLSVLASLEPWLQATKFRGCGFLNMASEIPDPRSPLRKEGVRLYDNIRERVESLATELIASDPERYRDLEVKQLTNDYMLAFVGAVAQAELYNAIWPVEQALQNVRRLIGE